MSFPCLTDCFEAGTIPVSYLTCGKQFRQHGKANAMLVRCDAKFENILSLDEWKTFGASGAIIPLPCGKLTTEEASQEEFWTGPCGEKEYDIPERDFEFTTPYAADDFKDEEYWCDLKDAGQYDRLMWTDCTGDRLYIAKAQARQVKAGDAAISRPGSVFSWTEPDFIEANGPGKNGVWKFNGTITGSYLGITIPGLGDCITQLVISTT